MRKILINLTVLMCFVSAAVIWIACGPTSLQAKEQAVSGSSAEDWTQYRGPRGDGKSTETLPDAWPAGGPKVIWKTETPSGFSSFSIANGRAFTLITREHEGEKREFVVALNADSGDEIWSKPLGESSYGHDGGNAGAPGNRGGDGPRSTPTMHPANLRLACIPSVIKRIHVRI